ncbi:MAG TPA: hypothetical protein VFH73_14005 [Polyangia bacterium]|nr:hypothetical protein [Polyangia bacterium]
MKSPVAVIAAVAVLVLTAAPFFLATTFIGDDHLFLSFSRYVPNPLAAFVRDHHGGEFYRPLPMTLWWLLARLGNGAAFPFALTALVLHTAVAVQISFLLSGIGEPRRAAWIAGGLFFLFPQTLEGSYWFSASTDLLATAATLASLTALARRRHLVSALFAACAYLCKEAALVLPLLGLIVLARRDRALIRRHLSTVAPQVALAAGFVLVRWLVLGGWGGAGDDRAPLGGKLLQLGSGVVHVVTGDAILPAPLAWTAGLLFFGGGLLHAAGRERRGEPAPWLPVLFIGAALLPLLAADWVVGARYFYLPAVGLAWLGGRWLSGGSAPALAMVGSTLLGLSFAQAIARRHDVTVHDARVAAARQAVSDGVAHGHVVFHVTAGIKDLDLIIKADPQMRPLESRLLVLPDVPASFIVVPPALESSLKFLSASPPIPPSGAYRFGGHRIVGLPRRGDDPTLAEVVRQLPDIRFIRVLSSEGSGIVAHDVTAEVKRTLD